MEQKILSTKENKKDELFHKTNVIGVGIGKKIVKGVETPEDAIRVYVTQKVGIKKLSKSDKIPKKYDEVSTDVIVSEMPTICTLLPEIVNISGRRKDRYRPVIQGVSIGNANITAGTNGILVQKDGEYYWHTDAHVGAEDPSKDISNQETNVLQPGPHDGGNSDIDSVGTLRYMYKIYPRGEGRNFKGLDSCLIKPIDESNLVDPEVMDLGIPLGSMEAVLGMKGTASGRTSSIMNGTIIDLDADILVNYGKFVALQEHCVLTTPMLNGGDSGSVFFNGMYAVLSGYAGASTLSVWNKITDIERTWICDVVTKDMWNGNGEGDNGNDDVDEDTPFPPIPKKWTLLSAGMFLFAMGSYVLYLATKDGVNIELIVIGMLMLLFGVCAVIVHKHYGLKKK